VPSVEAERIIGVTDPEDDSLVIWGVLSESDPPRQFVEGGEFFVLQRVENIPRVGDLLDSGALPPVPGQ
jgi:cytochrome c oxidase subunit 5b